MTNVTLGYLVGSFLGTLCKICGVERVRTAVKLCVNSEQFWDAARSLEQQESDGAGQAS